MNSGPVLKPVSKSILEPVSAPVLEPVPKSILEKLDWFCFKLGSTVLPHD